ncbi:MAG: hypothetical protein V7L21_10625 [Nostoc sp.]|uniref:hypothetical protein n=1 Tax=unclassified Nostoc TaxID=2593658 RepID=UPI0025DAF576|nr:hypothetical protein [Nostoc sp. NMS9]
MTTLEPVGIRAVSVNFPSIIRTNDYYRENFPKIVAEAEQKTLAKLFVPDNATIDSDDDIWSQEVAPYMSDPFRGTVERRVLAADETSQPNGKQVLEATLYSIYLKV